MVLSKETRAVLKLAGAALGAGRLLGAGVRGAVGTGADFVGGVTESMGGPASLGRVIGGGGVILGGAAAARKLKQKIDERRYGYAGGGNYGPY